MPFIREIDGLRAVAVVAILLFHLELKSFPGGFVGVDVFFVISGYLISRIIFAELDQKTFSFSGFYERRIRRIAPALLATLAVCTVYIVAMPPDSVSIITNSILAALFSLSNMWFYLTVDYFTDASSNPVLHTWSLAVEEQFYLFFPLFIVTLQRLVPGYRMVCLVIMWCLSLAAAQYVVAENKPAAFYLPWFRAWEFFTGSILAASAFTLPLRLRPAATVAGAVAIVLSILFFSTAMSFPGFSALLPVFGSAAVIAGAGGNSLFNSILSSPPMRGLGLISYSIYLVHWPLICLIKRLHPLTPPVVLVSGILTLTLAWMSWRFIETPFRRPFPRHRSSRNVFVVLSGSAALIVCFVVGSASAGRMIWERDPNAMRLASYFNAGDVEIGTSPCFLHSNSKRGVPFPIDTCLGFRPDRKNVLVLGDSHSAHLMRALRVQNPQVHFLQASVAGCKPTLDNPRGEAGCKRLIDFVLREWLPKQQKMLSLVLLSAQWTFADERALEDTVQYLLGHQLKVLIVGPSPEFYAPVPLLLAYDDMFNLDLTRKAQKHDNFTLDEALKSDPVLAPYYFSVTKNLCNNTVCLSQRNGVPLYFDGNHFTREGALLAVRGLNL